MRRWVLAALVLLMAAGGAGADMWESDAGIAGGLGDVGDTSVPTVFQKDGTWYLITGEGDDNGVLTGFDWTGSTWQSNTTIVGGTGWIGYTSAPAVFLMDGKWYLISGKYLGDFLGFDWTGSTWQSNATIVGGLGDVGKCSAPTVFQKDGTWYLISGEKDGVFTGYDWTGSTWQSNATMVGGLGDVGYMSALTVFLLDGKWYLISGNSDGVFAGYDWTGSTWQSNATMVGGLGDVGRCAAPAVFQMDATWYLISGEEDGVFTGYGMSYAPRDLAHTTGAYWVNHTWEHGYYATADSYNVSINGTWYNDTTNTFFNNTLSANYQWSNITVYGYNATDGLSDGYVTEDVLLRFLVPPPPTGTGSTWDYFWVNHTWTNGTLSGDEGNTDSYNVSVNDVWHNGTAEYFNNTLSDYGDWSNITVYAFNNTGGMNTTYIYQNVMIPLPIPAAPTELDSVWDYFWVNHTWTNGTPYFTGGNTDSYNISVNDVWHNGTTNEYYNDSLSAYGDWSNITVYAFNDSGGMNETSVFQNVQIPYPVPPAPVGLDSTFGAFWVNHTWTNGTPCVGNTDTDSYNISVNDVWHNGTTNEYYNDSLSAYGDWSNITVYAFNDSGGMNETPVYQNIQILHFIPAIPGGLGHTLGYCFVTHTWAEGAPYLACGDTDSYNVSVNDVWHNGTTNEYFTDTVVDCWERSNITVYAFNNTGGMNATGINQSIWVPPCTTYFFETFDNYTIGDLDDQGRWSANAAFDVLGAENKYMEIAISSQPPMPVWSCSRPVTACHVRGDLVVFSMLLSKYCAAGCGGGIDYSIDVNLKYGSKYLGVKIGDDYDLHIRDGGWHYIGTPTGLANDVFYEVYFEYDIVADNYTQIYYGSQYLGYFDSDIGITGDMVSLSISRRNMGTCTGESVIFDFDDIYVTEYNYPTYITLKDPNENLVTGCQVAIYDVTNDEYVQRYETDADGVLSVEKPVGTELQLSIRTFDGVFIEHFTIESGYPTQNITIPIHYNVNIHPEDPYGVPLFDVFCGLAEYTPINPLAFWGMDFNRGYVPVTNCSGFSRCDIVAEKGGYVPYEATGLNWTSRSAMVKNYRHDIIMVKE